jgi:hypothetical protein
MDGAAAPSPDTAAPSMPPPPAASGPSRIVITAAARARALAPGDSVLLRASVLDADGRPVPDARLAWTSSDTGRLALRAGRAGVYAVAGERTGPVMVTARAGAARGGLRVVVAAPRVARALDGGDVVPAPDPAAPAEDASSGAVARREIERFIANLEGRRMDALGRQLGAEGDPAIVRTFLAWLRGANRLEISPVVIGPSRPAEPGRAVSEFTVWLHWRTRTLGVSRRRAQEARFRVVLMQDDGAWRPVEVQLADPFPAR